MERVWQKLRPGSQRALGGRDAPRGWTRVWGLARADCGRMEDSVVVIFSHVGIG